MKLEIKVKPMQYQKLMRNTIFVLLLTAIGIFAGCSKFGNFWDKPAQTDTTLSNTVASPLYAPPAGSYNVAQSVAITSATSGATICYTTDGVTTPLCDASASCTTGTLYASTVSVPTTQTLMAIACKATMTDSSVSSAPYTLDTTPPTIAFTAPTAASYVTNTAVTYNNSTEACSTASITWARTGGTADPGAPHIQALIGAELTMGMHSAITLANNPTLVDGTVYDLTYACTDAAGNAAAPIVISNVTFDNTVPVISSVFPGSSTAQNTTNVSYTLSEVCSTAAITWTRTGGTFDGGSPHVQSLVGGELTAGAHNAVTLTNNPTLVSGSIYTIEFTCIDFAAHTATAITQTSVTYDNVKPVISALAPASGTAVNNTTVSYNMSETCSTASITWTRSGGVADGNSPHTQVLTASEMAAGLHSGITITNNPILVDGAIYDITADCSDAAGNTATTVSQTNILFDTTTIVISAVAPATNAFVNNTKVSYTLSETCQTGSITWSRTSGAADVGSPHAQNLSAGERAAGAHTAITLASPPTLVDGAIYTVTFACTDAAANVATPIVLTGVTYDTTAPLISGLSPTAGTAVNTQQIGYTFSESCATAMVTWTRTGGVADTNHNQALVSGELASGAHAPFIITNNPTLVSGAIYTVEINCTDAAGNTAIMASATAVTFDNTAPIVSIQNLKDNGGLFTSKVICPASDNVALASVEFNLDSTTWSAATGPTPFTFGLPNGASTWKDRSLHNIQVRATDTAGNVSAVVSVNVRKGNNRDINGDGYEDFAVSAHKHDGTEGAMYIYYGMAGAIPDDTSGSAPTIQSNVTSDFFGRNFAFADFNSDGFADVAVAAPTVALSASPGSVLIYHGAVSGLNLTPAITLSGESNKDQFGSILIAGDLDGDGYADLVVGAGSYNANTQVGRVYFYRSSGTGITTSVWKKITGENAAHQFGLGLALGDFDGDNATDIAISAPRYSNGGFDGRIYGFYNIPSMSANTTAAPGDAVTTGTAGEYMGASLSSGDINGDGKTDIAIGAVYNSSNVGRVYVHYGTTGTGLSTTYGATLSGLTTPGYLGTVVSVRDMNNDGFDDILTGAHGNGVNAGRAFIFYGQSANLGALNTSSGGVYSILGENSSDFFGRGLNSTDVNGDGFPDLVVGAPIFNASRGRVYIIYGTAVGPIETLASAGANTVLDGQSGQTSEYATSFNR